MITLKQVRDKRKQVDALKLAYDASEQNFQAALAAYHQADADRLLHKGAYIAGRDHLEELGREFALDEGENDHTPTMTFEPPALPFTGTGKTAKIIDFPNVGLPTSGTVTIDPAANAEYSLNKQGIVIKEYTDAHGNLVCEAMPDDAALTYDPNKLHRVKRTATESDYAFDARCSCNVSATASKSDGKPCTYHKQRGEFFQPLTENILYYPLHVI